MPGEIPRAAFTRSEETVGTGKNGQPAQDTQPQDRAEMPTQVHLAGKQGKAQKKNNVAADANSLLSKGETRSWRRRSCTSSEHLSR